MLVNLAVIWVRKRLTGELDRAKLSNLLPGEDEEGAGHSLRPVKRIRIPGRALRAIG